MSDVILYSFGLSPNNDSQNKIFLKSNWRGGVLYKVKKAFFNILLKIFYYIFSISIGFHTKKTVPTQVTGAETIVINQDLVFNVGDVKTKLNDTNCNEYFSLLKSK